MSFGEDDYQAAAARLCVPVAAIKAVSESLTRKSGRLVTL